jgi:hypothetical protein
MVGVRVFSNNNRHLNLGCRKCYKDPQQVLGGGRTQLALNTATQKRLKFLRKKGYRLHVMWECDFRRQLDMEKEMRESFNKLALPDTPLHPRRHGLRGGRVEAFKLHHQCAADEEILHLDVVSLILNIIWVLQRFIEQGN